MLRPPSLIAHRRPNGLSLDEDEPVPEYVSERRERSFGKGTRPVDAARTTQSDNGGQAGYPLMDGTLDTDIWQQAQTPKMTGTVHCAVLANKRQRYEIALNFTAGRRSNGLCLPNNSALILRRVAASCSKRSISEPTVATSFASPALHELL
jgi:hypothetical protein